MSVEKILSIIEDIKVEGNLNEYEAVEKLAYKVEEKLREEYCVDAEVEYDYDLEETGDPFFAGVRLTLKCNGKRYELIATVERIVRASVTDVIEK